MRNLVTSQPLDIGDAIVARERHWSYTKDVQRLTTDEELSFPPYARYYRFMQSNLVVKWCDYSSVTAAREQCFLTVTNLMNIF